MKGNRYHSLMSPFVVLIDRQWVQRIGEINGFVGSLKSGLTTSSAVLGRNIRSDLELLHETIKRKL